MTDFSFLGELLYRLYSQRMAQMDAFFKAVRDSFTYWHPCFSSIYMCVCVCVCRATLGLFESFHST